MWPPLADIVIMKVVVWVCTCATVVSFSFTAPVEDAEQKSGYFSYGNDQMDYLRNKRLNSNSYYMTPCQAAAAAASASSDSSYQTNFAPAQTRFAPNSYGYKYSDYDKYPEYDSVYRSDDPYRDGREIMSYSDSNFIENNPTARFAKKLLPTTVVTGPVVAPMQGIPSYLPLNAANLAGLTGQLATQIGPAYGAFPNANIGGCNVPLFFSCTPSISPGRIGQVGPPVVYPSPVLGASPIDFRGVDENQGLHANREEQFHAQLVNTPVKNTPTQIKEKHS